MLKNKWLRFTVVILAVLVIIYFLGPHPAAPAYTKAMPAVPADTAALRQYVQQGESLHKLKPNNEARIVWYNDSLKNKTGIKLWGTLENNNGESIHFSNINILKRKLHLLPFYFPRQQLYIKKIES